MKRTDRDILAIDLKSFYASVECIKRNLDPFKVPLVVADESRGDGTIVLAASPFIKEKYGVKSRCRLFEVDKNIPGLVIACPHMKDYLQAQADVIGVYLDYVSKEDLYVYSVDECFLDVTNYLKRGNDTSYSYAEKIVDDVKRRTGLTVTAGIGKNLFMAKACMDIEAKKSPSFIAKWDYEDIPYSLWPVAPLHKMWGIGSRMERKLNAMGFYSVGDIACSSPTFLKKEIGVIGEEIYYHSLGYDDALLQERYEPRNKSFSVGEVLLRDYKYEEVFSIIGDLSHELCERLKKSRKVSYTFSCTVVTADDSESYHFRAVFESPTSSAFRLTRQLKQTFGRLPADRSTNYRRVLLCADSITEEDSFQTSLFDNVEENGRTDAAEEVMIRVRDAFGTEKAMPAFAATKESTYRQRSHQIGGHLA